MSLQRLFLDTNVFIIGVAMPESPEAVLLDWLGFFHKRDDSPVVVVSDALIEQIRRVGRRVGGKDHAGELIARLWENLSIHHVLLEARALAELYDVGRLPREDVPIYLTALAGKVDCFVSANHKLIKALAATKQQFEFLTPVEFVSKYLEGQS